MKTVLYHGHDDYGNADVVYEYTCETVEEADERLFREHPDFFAENVWVDGEEAY